MKLAYDRIGSVRSVDEDGRLHVEKTPISKANVCEYHGREIPNHESLGLDADKFYKLYRHPDELKKGASTFNGLQVLDGHTPVSADAPQKDQTVGAMGTDAKFEAPYLTNSMTVWDSNAIRKIKDGTQRELSCAYRYTPDMTAGRTPDGHSYDGIMRDIRGNHLALVDTGRAGSDVLVQDGKPYLKRPKIAQDEDMGMMDLVASLRDFMPDLSDDQIRALASKMIAEGNEMKGGEQSPLGSDKDHARAALARASEELKKGNLTKEQAAEIRGKAEKILGEKHAADGENPMEMNLEKLKAELQERGLDDKQIEDAINAAMSGAEDESEEEKHRNEVEGGRKANREIRKERREGAEDGDDDDGECVEDSERLENAVKMAKSMFDNGKKAEDVRRCLEENCGFSAEEAEEATKRGDDQASDDEDERKRDEDRGMSEDRINRIVEKRMKAERRRLVAMDSARAAVRPLVGELVAMDSASAVYRTALKHCGIACDGVNEAGLAALVKSQINQRAPAPVMASDSASASKFAGVKLPKQL